MKAIQSVLILFLIPCTSLAQDFGMSFSYFIPKNGYFSTPISPFSIRGIGFGFTDFLAIETGASLYRMAGLNIKDLPFESKQPLTGPNFTIFVPVELVIELKGNNVQFDIKGGGFFFYGFDQRIDYGNMDRAMREYYGLELVNADLTFSNHPGVGYHAGVEFTFYMNSQLGISLEANYLVGQSKFPLTGTYSGGENNNITTEPVEYPDAKIDLTGFEFSIGLTFSSGNAGPPRRRR